MTLVAKLLTPCPGGGWASSGLCCPQCGVIVVPHCPVCADRVKDGTAHTPGVATWATCLFPRVVHPPLLPYSLSPAVHTTYGVFTASSRAHMCQCTHFHALAVVPRFTPQIPLTHVLVSHFR